MSARPSQPWWHHAVIYQVYPRSFASTSGAVGTLEGVRQKLNYLQQLGVDAIWLSPFYPSPQRDAGYDVSDYCQVDPTFGTLAHFDALVESAHARDIRIVIDLVPNHTSDQHRAFQAALAAGPGSAQRDWYWFVDSEQPPNNWKSIFGGSAWTQVCQREDAAGSPWEDDQQWYLNLFDSSQPDLNWDNPQVREYFDQVLRFWLDRGVDGFRIDVAHGLVKDRSLPNWEGEVSMVDGGEDDADTTRAPMFDQEGVHEIYRRWNAILASYPGERMLVAEAWVDPQTRLARYVRNDEMHQAFNFAFLCCPWQAQELEQTITDSLHAFRQVGRPATWVLSNHDVVRHASRLGLEETGKGPNGIRAREPQPDAALGLARARAATALMLSLPGSAYLYQGEELGLPEHTTLEDKWRQDPAFFRTKGAEAGRDGCRIPLPWAHDAAGCGFSPTGETWLPQPPGWAELAADLQSADTGSTLNFYRRALALRRDWELGQGEWSFQPCEGGVLRGINRCEGGEVLVITTVSAPSVVPSDWVVKLCSDPTLHLRAGDEIPVNTTVWCQRGN
ncbi:MAG: glycoside hydrolase family 13 protein [Actinomycetaceae bacterium]|nr:glycoside hydrolase family 13 protein [Actinomycetaceae bacterium]